MFIHVRFLAAAAAGVLLAVPAAAQSSFGNFEVDLALPLPTATQWTPSSKTFLILISTNYTTGCVMTAVIH